MADVSLFLPQWTVEPDPADTSKAHGVDREVLKQRLIEAGYAPEDVERWLSVAPKPGQTLKDALVEAGAPEGVAAVIEGTPGARIEEASPTVLAERARQGAVLGPEAMERLQEAVEKDPTLLQGADDPVSQLLAVASQYGGVDEWNYDWVYNDPELQLRPGVLQTEAALIQLWNHFEEFGVVEPQELSDAAKASAVKEILARNPGNIAVRMAVNEWASEQNHRMPDHRVDGVSLGTIQVLTKLGMTQPRAISVARVADQFEIDPVELAQIWESSDEVTARFVKRPMKNAATLYKETVGRSRGPVPERPTREFTRSVKRPIMDVAASYKAGLALYNESRVLAAVHVNDPVLARRLANDPYGLDSGELRRVLDYIGGAEGKEGDPQVGWILNRLAGAYEVTAEVDSEQVRNAVQTLADAWNLTGTDGVAAAIAGEMIADAIARARATLPNPFRQELGSPVSVQETIQDITAHVKARFRQLPEYQELFAQKREGESEEEYVRRFEAESQRILGDDNAAAVRAGMRTGNINAIYQQALHAGAGDASTRFQQIIARNAEVFREFL